ncbi:MAG: hypothetical protein WCY53_04865 [Sphaerochaetaceae bacterium]
MKRLNSLPRDASDEQIRLTVEALKRHHYEPVMVLDAKDFLGWKKEDLVKEFKRLDSLKADDQELLEVKALSAQDVIEKQKSLLFYHYELLCRLRDGDSEAWDVVHELYEDD